jgi:hypothetical protein
MKNLSSGTERKAEIPTTKADQTECRFYRFFSFDTGRPPTTMVSNAATQSRGMSRLVVDPGA